MCGLPRQHTRSLLSVINYIPQHPQGEPCGKHACLRNSAAVAIIDCIVYGQLALYIKCARSLLLGRWMHPTAHFTSKYEPMNLPPVSSSRCQAQPEARHVHQNSVRHVLQQCIEDRKRNIDLIQHRSILGSCCFLYSLVPIGIQGDQYRYKHCVQLYYIWYPNPIFTQ